MQVLLIDVVFIRRNPTTRIPALSFLLLISLLLVAERVGHHVPKGYVYFAICFSFAVEMLQLWTLRPQKAVSTESPY
jgi:predicted tellurium resistance membrane protein TerC